MQADLVRGLALRMEMWRLCGVVCLEESAIRASALGSYLFQLRMMADFVLHRAIAVHVSLLLMKPNHRDQSRLNVN